MIEGHVNSGLEPIIELRLKNGDTLTTIQAVVDTGFSGELCLSEQYANQIDMAFEFAETYELANGALVVEDVFSGEISFDGQLRNVHFILTQSKDTLVGASLLRPRKLTVDYSANFVRID